MKPTHGNCDQFMAEGQPCSGWQAQQAEIERLRALLRECSLHLTEIVRMPNAEHIADAHNTAVRRIKAALAAKGE